MIRYHIASNGIKIAEILPESDLISSPEEMLDIMADIGYNDSSRVIIHSKNFHQNFFDLKTGLAGEILQKFSNYRMRLAIVGDFKHFKSKSLKDFIRESNSGSTIYFVDTLDEALLKFER